MIGIIFYMEDNNESIFSDPLVWRRLINAFNVDSYCIIDKTKAKTWKGWEDGNRPSKVVDNIDDALERYKSARPVHITKNGHINLVDFQHPKNAVYIFGADSGETDPKDGVRINVPVQLWAIQAASIVLYDRSIDYGTNSSL